MEQLCDLLRDPKIEVREAAAATLSGIVRCSQRSSILVLSRRFMAVIRSTKIPKRRDAAGAEVDGYQEALATARECEIPLKRTQSVRLSLFAYFLRLCRSRNFLACQRLPLRGAIVHPKHSPRDCSEALGVPGAHLDYHSNHAVGLQALAPGQVGS